MKRIIFLLLTIALLVFYGVAADAETHGVVIMTGDYHRETVKDNEVAINLAPELAKRGVAYLALEATAGVKVELGRRLERFLLSNKENFEYYLSDEEIMKIKKKVEQILEEYSQGRIKWEDIPEFWKTYENKRFPGWFGLITAARKAGLKIVFYDPPLSDCKSQNDRDLKAFQNIKKEIFDKDPDAGVWVYCGSSHLGEKDAYYKNLDWFDQKSFSSGIDKFRTIAYYLEQYTGGRNLTVDLSNNPDLKGGYVDMLFDLEKEDKEMVVQKILKNFDLILRKES